MLHDIQRWCTHVLWYSMKWKVSLLFGCTWQLQSTAGIGWKACFHGCWLSRKAAIGEGAGVLKFWGVVWGIHCCFLFSGLLVYCKPHWAFWTGWDINLSNIKITKTETSMHCNFKIPGLNVKPENLNQFLKMEDLTTSSPLKKKFIHLFRKTV